MGMHGPWAMTIAAITLAACASSGNGTDGSSATADQACVDWATHYCNRRQSCDPVSVQILYGDVPQCITRSKPRCASALMAQGTGATPGSVEQCAQAYDSASCSDVDVEKPPAACIVPGALAHGARCGDDSQCSGANAYCAIAAEQTCGTCSTLAAAGAVCSGDGDCQYGLACALTCTTPVANGGACDATSHFCARGLVCMSGKCSAGIVAGMTCDPQADNCDASMGLSCDAQTRICSRKPLATVGASCTTTACVGGTWCSPVTTTCVADALDGARCTGPDCLAPARCINGTCTLPDPTTCL